MQPSWQNLKAQFAAMKHDPTTRPKRYDNIDGTGEMFFGLMFLGFALLGWLQGSLPTHSVWKTHSLLNLLFMYLVLGPVLGMGFLGQKWVKRRFTWRRTGYVARGLPGTGGNGPATTEAARKTRKLMRWGWLIIVAELAVFAGLLGAGVAWLFAYEMKHPDALNLVLAGKVFYLGYWLVIYAFWVGCMGKGQAWKWGVWLFLAAGLLVIGFPGGGDFETVAHPVILFSGCVWFLSGLITLVLYLRHNPSPAPEAE